MAQDLRNNDWDPESNAVALDEPLFREEDVRRATMGPHPGSSGMISPSGWMNNGYATWTTYTSTGDTHTWGPSPTTVSYSTSDFSQPSFNPAHEYTYHSASWKDTLAASLFLIKYAFKMIWRKYLNRPIGVNIRWER